MIILLAEDDTVTREAVVELLEGEGHQVLAARDGREALDFWKRHRPGLVLLDIMMPHASGYEVCRTIRREDRHTPVLFLSAKSEEVDVVLGLELGADDFVRKPFGKHELLIASQDGREIELTTREVKVLHLLSKRRGEVVTRDELLNECWGLEYYPESRTLDQHILNLRKKLEANPSQPVLIETVRGAGYRSPA